MMIERVTDGALKRVIDVMNMRGIDLSVYNKGFLKRRIANRLRKTRAHSLSHYTRILEQREAEVELLKKELSVNVTEFYRDPPVWAALASILQDLLSRKAVVRIWSAGCASGEEAYSLALLGLKLSEKKKKPGVATSGRVWVTATDIDSAALEIARKGIYPHNRLRNLSRWDRLHFFVEEERGWYRVSPVLKRSVRFLKDDLAHSLVGGHMDIILCRNIMIYMSQEATAEIWENMVRLTAPGSYLIIGRSETIPPAFLEYFHTVDAKNRIYMRKWTTRDQRDPE